MKSFMRFNIMLVIALLTIGTISFCKKDSKFLTANATVVNMGPLETDGCGWMVKIDGAFYSAINLPDEYKKTDEKVKINYLLLSSKYHCGIANLQYPQIDIKSINK